MEDPPVLTREKIDEAERLINDNFCVNLTKENAIFFIAYVLRTRLGIMGVEYTKAINSLEDVIENLRRTVFRDGEQGSEMRAELNQVLNDILTIKEKISLVEETAMSAYNLILQQNIDFIGYKNTIDTRLEAIVARIDDMDMAIRYLPGNYEYQQALHDFKVNKDLLE